MKKKEKNQIGINWGNKPNKFICSIHTWTSYLPFGICYCFKAEKQFRKFQRENMTSMLQMELQMNSPWECGLINLINPYLAFFFFRFPTTTLLQSGVFSYIQGFILVSVKKVTFFKQFYHSVKKPQGFSCFESNFFFIRNLFKKVMIRVILVNVTPLRSQLKQWKPADIYP